MDNYDNYDLPRGMRKYLKHHGWHFSKSMCEWAVSRMKKRGAPKETIAQLTKEQVDEMLKRHNVKLDEPKGYDYVYVAHMGMADYLGSSIIDEGHLALYVKDVCTDVDGYAGLPFVRFYADCCHTDTPIDWEDML
jgi:hypothetical protein